MTVEPEFANVAIIGNGAMGTVCAMILCEKGKDVIMWGHDRAEIDEMNSARENIRYLPGYPLPQTLKLEHSGKRALEKAELIVNAVPCQYLRSVFSSLLKFIPPRVPIVSVTKGLEVDSLKRPTEILEDLAGKRDYIALSGPSIADEIARKLPATVTAAAKNPLCLEKVQKSFFCNYLRVYTNQDLVGVELGGALKNVIAIAAGIVDGIGAGDNAKAALLSRGLAEIRRLGVALDARAETFSGLSGLGDLVTTCISKKGRNRSFGELLGQGYTAKEALGSTRSVVEGAATCESVVSLAEKLNVELPISMAVREVVAGRLEVKEAITSLMNRSPKREWY